MDNNQLLTRAVAKALPEELAKKKLASGEKLRIYWGIDPTGGRIHMGHSVPLRKMQQFAKAGHHVTLVIGSFTAMIGDPSDKDALRKRLTRNDVQKNFESYKEQAAKILDFSKIEIRYNHEWLEKLTFEEVVELASHFTVQQMLERDNFEKRIKSGKPVYIHEFMYPLMVGYDSVVLDVDCEIGGTDQEFNMLAGRTLQTAFGKRDKFVLTTKLIEGTDGRLMSKTYDNCVYINDAPGDMFGKILSMKDELITLYMECCTDIPESEIAATEKAMKNGENPKDFKVRLAKEIVTMYHSAQDATNAAEEFERVFKGGGLPDNMPEATAKKGSVLIDVLVREGLVASKSDARRLVEQGGIKLNDTPINSIDATVEDGIVRVGKRKFLSLKIG
ncbi:tyrosine--tRNA ligase [Candidatus Peregrinibacteria bacterium CG10_big_fil_rev_8_21_14_0_10_49_24]|nr:MAG: tyrosine--tRNA ligase [Candidatus Peregrinibacteria bacterium CG11_big_fil_rev_8_21_14_0_20_49_14]PIR50983.1 MAG: tyrosine--tRNA ligase [Candidatus Peregrinibacteria bacterium CG10_big_fil_rev_8_21_14_0_10_49_24]PJA67536.1 MAG: tyrosine--tRNA ligase [Candidatus Peregrinibacteria bacterium CG_4_9_14_3_um_filter_49_12]